MRILVGVDFSKSSELAVEEVARRAWPAGSLIDTKTQAARMRIESMAAELVERGLPVSAVVIPGRPRSRLNDYAARWKADLIVVGSRGFGLFRRALLGSVATAVVRRGPCSVEIVRPRSGVRRRGPGMRILLATDGSGCSLEAASSVAGRPWPSGSRVRVVSVAQPVRPVANVWTIPSRQEARLDSEVRRAAHDSVAATRRVLESCALPVSASVPVGEPKNLLVEESRRWNADLIVVGSHGRRGLDRLFLGSVSEAVALHASCSVEVVRCERRP